MTVGVIHLGLGNIGSLCQCLERLGVSYQLVTEPGFQPYEQLLFPGVGHFGRASEILDRGWRQPILSWIEEGKAFLGICLGYQLLYQGSEEEPQAEGLGVFEATCSLVLSQKRPHMGWNQLQSCEDSFSQFDQQWMYFVHSFAPPVTSETIFSSEDGLGDFSVGACRGQVGGVQFHPEKSYLQGQKFLKFFLEKTSC